MRSCPKCGADVFPGATDCPSCGAVFDSEGNVAATSAKEELTKPVRVALTVSLAFVGTLLILVGTSAIQTSRVLAGLMISAGIAAMYGAFRVWRGSARAATLGAVGLIVFFVLLAVMFRIADGMRH